ncbi:basic region/leucine zipper transcription factor 16 [Striga hermonthica]|uniref:Basic region/leucine zipper transcription factor 16 n=1 Tax=Striga hermonthica TaxID=68872 RepID=A0A9N7RBI8_STRHE|nr:basic region/leucine zipper transcription factor 16 [Striga hermonthica]
MGSSEVDKSSKEGKEEKEPKTPAAQEQSSAASGAVAADWSGFQAYSPVPPPPGFLASNPQAHPYIWGVQQFIPPYGTPPPPYVMYPHGSYYAHPTMAPGSYPFSPFAMPSPNGIAEASGNASGNMEVDGKSSEAKGKLPVKRSKGSLGSLNMITGKNNEPGKTSGATPNGLHSKSAESASEGSSGGSDTHSQNGSQVKSAGRQDSAEPSQNGSTGHSSQNGGPNISRQMVNQPMHVVPISAVGGVPGPPTNLNIGMDYWGTIPSSSIPAMRGKVSAAPVAAGMVTAGSRDSIQSQLWIQDERELKRQRRKQSNRESARRSRLRKQAECDELAQRAETLKKENATLKAELAHIKSEYEQLLAQNTSLKERLGELPGEEEPRCSHDDQRSNTDAQ